MLWLSKAEECTIGLFSVLAGGLYIGSNQFNISTMALNGNKAFSGGSIYIKAPLADNAWLSGLNFGDNNAARRGDCLLGFFCSADATPEPCYARTGFRYLHSSLWKCLRY